DVLATAGGKRFPQRLIAIQTYDRIGKVGGRVGDQHVLAGRQVHSLDRWRRCDNRQAIAHRQVDLAFDACAVTERGNRNTAAAEIRGYVGDVAGNDEIIGGQRFDRRWNQTADDDRLDAG